MLFKRLHLQLTGLCALITVAILSVFTLLYLSVSEHAMQENAALNFRNNFDTLKGSLEQQSVLTYQYLLRMEQNNDCLIFLWDNGSPLTFNSLKSHAAYETLAGSMYESYLARAEELILTNDTLFIDENPAADNIYIGISHVASDQMTASQRLSAARDNRGLVLLILSPNGSLHGRLVRQRVTITLLSLAGCLLLTLFSYIFTGKMIRPLRENHEKQLDFIAGASHELRTPLAVVLSAVNARPPGFEETVRLEVLRMGRLIEELLLLSRLDRPDAGSLFSFAPLPPDTFLLNFYEQMENYVLSHGRRLSLSLPDEPFPAIYADKDKLRQLLEILTQNAVSYTETGGHISLALSYEKKAHRICFQVADDGNGIPDEEKSRIFERFYRAESAHHSKEHFGLGLCIAKEIAEAHKGEILVTDTPGGGCTFRCSLPVSPS